MKVWWRATGKWGWVCAFLVGSALVSAIFFNQLSFISLGWQEQGKRKIEDVEITLSTRGPIKPGRPIEVKLEGIDDLEGYVGAGSSRVPLSKENELQVPRNAEVIEVIVELEGGSAVWVLGQVIGVNRDET